MPEQDESFPTPIKRSLSDRVDGVESRNRNLATIDQLFKATGGPDVFIAKLLQDHSRLDVIEVGFGWGIALLELAWQFRDQPIFFRGVDIEWKEPLSTEQGIIDFAREVGIIPSDHPPTFNIPKLAFYDASRLQDPDESADFIYSAVTIRFMKDKVGFIEETARVLRPGGIALLHIGESNWNYPRGPISDPRILTPFTSRLVLKHDDELIPLPEYFNLFEGGGFKFSFSQDSRCILQIEKQASGKLDLGLKMNQELTLPGRAVPLVNRKGEVRGGVRSVYDVATNLYSRLSPQ